MKKLVQLVAVVFVLLTGSSCSKEEAKVEPQRPPVVESTVSLEVLEQIIADYNASFFEMYSSDELLTKARRGPRWWIIMLGCDTFGALIGGFTLPGWILGASFSLLGLGYVELEGEIAPSVDTQAADLYRSQFFWNYQGAAAMGNMHNYNVTRVLESWNQSYNGDISLRFMYDPISNLWPYYNKSNILSNALWEGYLITRDFNPNYIYEMHSYQMLRKADMLYDAFSRSGDSCVEAARILMDWMPGADSWYMQALAPYVDALRYITDMDQLKNYFQGYIDELSNPIYGVDEMTLSMLIGGASVASGSKIIWDFASTQPARPWLFGW